MPYLPSEQAPLPKHDVKTTNPVPGFPTEGSSATGGHPLVVSLLYVLETRSVYEPIQRRTSVARIRLVFGDVVLYWVLPNTPDCLEMHEELRRESFHKRCLWHRERCSRATPRALSDEPALL